MGIRRHKDAEPVTPDSTGIDEQTAHLLPLAEYLQERINDQLAGDRDIDAAFESGFTDLGKLLIEQHLADMSAEEFIKLYERVLGRTALVERVEKWAEIKRVDLERDAKLATIKREAVVERRLRLEHLAPGEVLTIGLFEPTHPERAAHQYHNDKSIHSLHRTIQVRLVDPESGTADVFYDIWQGPAWADAEKTDLQTPNQRGQIGSQQMIGANKIVVPELTLHTPLAYKFGDAQEFESSVQIIGFVETADKILLLDGSQKK